MPRPSGFVRAAKASVGRAWLRLFGWKAIGTVPEPQRCVLIAAPHTSNWDLPFMLAIAWTIDLRVSWMGKHTLFKPPFGPLLKWLGGIPVDRRAPRGIVGQMVETFANREEMVLVVPPEGTRGRVEYWKSGFYEIAKAAGVPIAFGFLDYGKREGGIGPSILPTNDVVADMDQVRAFYADKVGYRREDFGEPRLKAESFPKPRVVGG